MEWTEFEQWASPGRHTEDVITLCGGVVAANAVSAGMTLGRDPLLLLLQELGWLDTTFELWWQVQDSNLRRR